MTRRWAGVGLLLALTAFGPMLHADQPPGAKLDEKAKEAMKAMGEFMTNLKEFALEAEETIDEFHDSGMKVQMSQVRRALVCRPCFIHSTVVGDGLDRCFFYNGKTATIFERDKNMYITVPVADTIDKMMDELHLKFEVTVPLAELLMTRPDAMMMEKVDTAHYLGEHVVDGMKCHHVACSQRDVDWQVWIETGARPLPKKLVITYKRVRGEPQYMAVIKKWDLQPKMEKGCFDFTAPPGAMKMDHWSPKADK
jgi:hypothetical protein